MTFDARAALAAVQLGYLEAFTADRAVAGCGIHGAPLATLRRWSQSQFFAIIDSYIDIVNFRLNFFKLAFNAAPGRCAVSVPPFAPGVDSASPLATIPPPPLPATKFIRGASATSRAEGLISG